MNVTSLENCKRLYELSKWDDKELSHHSEQITVQDYKWTPAYTAGYLLRKLPPTIEVGKFDFYLTLNKYGLLDDWCVCYLREFDNGVSDEHRCTTDTPEDALCLLAIKLFEEGILTKENK